MRIFLVLVITLFTVCISELFAQGSQNKLQITYVANEGYLLQTPRHKLLIDAIFTESYGIFDVPGKDTIDAILNGRAPFDNVDMCLLTHYHKDHCEPLLIEKYLKKFPAMKLLTNKNALVFIDGDRFGFVTLKKQFCELTPAPNASCSQVVNGVQITAHGMKHLSYYRGDVDLEEYMFNVAYCIEADGLRIFHSGDTSIENMKKYLDRNQDADLHADVAFLYYEMLNSVDNLKYIISKLKPKKIIIMHVPLYLNAQWQQKKEELKTVFPELYLMNKTETVSLY